VALGRAVPDVPLISLYVDFLDQTRRRPRASRNFTRARSGLRHPLVGCRGTRASDRGRGGKMKSPGAIRVASRGEVLSRADPTLVGP
jgi:hypothetical protein